MKSTTKEIEMVSDFPCLMEHGLQGEIGAGIYLVSRVQGRNNENNFRFTLMDNSDESIGQSHTTKEINFKDEH